MNPNLDGVRCYDMADGWQILVGKTAKDNDRLSLRIGKAGDFWFHVAGMPGSHVVARHADQPLQCPREIKRVAAGLAAFFSKAKTGGQVAVHWTTCKNVSKPPGLAPGKVTLKKYDSINISPLDPDLYFGGNP